MTSQFEKQTITIQIFPNISKSKGNWTMKFCHLRKLRNIFLEKSYTKCGGETRPRPSEKSKLSISLDQQSKALFSLLLLYAKFRAIELNWN